ncbi:MAG: STAS domain-containing protein [Lentisphaeria bacterium]|nr:STAS domain-containing protein [Lentisphaeria bacterium]
MDIAMTTAGDAATVRVSGRLDARNADILSRELDECVRGGWHVLRMNLHDVEYISSAGIRVLIKFAKILQGQGGWLEVLEPSSVVASVLEMTGTMPLFAPRKEQSAATATAGASGCRQIGAMRCTVTASAAGVSMRGRVLGNPAFMARNGSFAPGEVRQLRLGVKAVALGIGAFAADHAGAKGHYGEFLAAGGVAVALPPDSNGQPDFVVSEQRLVPELAVLSALHLEGDFAVQARFESSPQHDGLPGLSDLGAAALALSGASQAVMVALAETSGLVGASLLQSPEGSQDAEYFHFPEARRWFNLTPERVHGRQLVLLVGVFARQPAVPLADHLRPMADSADALRGHVHAAVLSYRALPGGSLALPATLADIFQTQTPLDLLHLINDDRAISGAGDSLFQRGVLWVSPLGEVDMEGGAQ